MMQDHYSINISYMYRASGWDGEPKYMHYCKVAVPHGSSRAEALAMLATMREKFQAPTYKVDMIFWEARGYHVED